MSAVGPDRSTKRHKGDVPPPDYNTSYAYNAAGRYQQPYGAAPMQWQYGNAPHTWGSHGSPPPGAVPGPYPNPQQRVSDRGGYYPRGPPPMQGPPPPRPGSKATPAPQRQGSKTPDGVGPQATPMGGYQPYDRVGYPSHYPRGPPMWHGNNVPGGFNGQMGYHATAGSSPARPGPPPSHPRASPEMMNGNYSGAPPPPPPAAGSSSVCQPVGNEPSDMDMNNMYQSRSVGVGPPHGGGGDDGDESTMGGNQSQKDKGRGSYKCGRCGVPKKGHICPYQPKLTRRPGEPLPEMRCAAIQVEMDEFMTLRRLNLKIQGFPESYAAEPFMEEDMVVGEPRSAPISSGSPPGPIPQQRNDSMPLADGNAGPPTSGGLPPNETLGMIGSPIRSSPINEEPITGAA